MTEYNDIRHFNSMIINNSNMSHIQTRSAYFTYTNSGSTLDKQRICVNTQLKSSKKQLKLNVCVPKSNFNDRYAITCDVIAYHLVHFFSISVINKCQSGIDFFLLASVQCNSSL